MDSLSEQEIIRRESLEKLRELGIDPYPAEEFKFDNYSENIKNNFSDLESKDVIIAGRIMSRRIMGKASFIELKDGKGRIQVYISKDDISNDDEGTMYNIVFKKLLDIGDIIGIKGFVFKTQMGEISVHAKELKILCKSLRPLPIVKKDEQGNIHDAFSDIELRYRQRYVDLIVNEDIKEIFIKRTKIMNIMRDFFNEKGYFEVETPILQSIPGGAIARPFVTHHNALDIPLYLRIANELYLKKLIVGGFDGVYEFSKDFRNEGMDRTHNPEFTVMELYVAYKDYNWMMDMTESLISKITKNIYGKSEIKIGETLINFEAPYKRISILDAIKENIGIDISNMNEEELKNICKKLNIEINDTMGKGKLIDTIFGETTEYKIIQPTFITDYPIEMSPLSKKHRSKNGLTERFELIVNGKEIANSYSELNDPIDQKERFEQQLRLSEKGDDEAMFIDYDFLRALEYGMPPTGGIGIGIDRLVMLMTNQVSIQEVLFFPQMKPEKKKNIPNISDFEKLGISKEWAEVIVKNNLYSLEKLKELKATQIHQNLNGFRKKNKLEIPALSLEEIEKWIS